MKQMRESLSRVKAARRKEEPEATETASAVEADLMAIAGLQ